MWPSLSGSWPWSHSCPFSRTSHQGKGSLPPDQSFLMCPVALSKNRIRVNLNGSLCSYRIRELTDAEKTVKVFLVCVHIIYACMSISGTGIITPFK